MAAIQSGTKYKIPKIKDSSQIILVGVVASSIVLFIPIYFNVFKTSGCNVFETIFIAIHNMIRLFVVDGDFEFITANVTELPDEIAKGYTVLFSILFVMAPILTFGFVLSFFKNLSAYRRYIMYLNKDVYIFSELNDKSIALAKSLYENGTSNCLIFADVRDDNSELFEKAEKLGAIKFKKDILSVYFSIHSPKKELNFFAISDDENKNTSVALRLIEKFKSCANTNLYVFSSSVESEMIFFNTFKNGEKAEGDSEENNLYKIKVRRVNDVQSLILRNLYDVGYEKIFASAYDGDDGNKKINAIVIGMGKHGTEMTKALSWFCQMDDYDLRIDSFDMDENAESRFVSECPELMSEKFNGKFDIKGEAKYEIRIHSGYDAFTKKFDDYLMTLPKATYVFVALGNDEKNISIAVKMRSLCSRIGIYPEIQSVVYSSDKKEALSGVVNSRGQKYDIDFMGDLNSSYSERVILKSEIERLALERHMNYGADESQFWQYNYNYKSSVASVIHKNLKIKCKMPGIEKDPKDREEKDLWRIRIVEHMRWNAYMRSEGFSYSQSIEKSSRNDLAKLHNYLVEFDKLPIEEQIKDDD